SLVSTSFLHPNNLNNILVQVSTLAILGVGMTFVLLTGQIDLSIATLVTLTGIVSAYLFNTLQVPEPWPTVAGIGIAMVLGVISGLASTKFRIPAFMATLAMSLIASGLATWISQGRTYFTISPVAQFLGSGRVAGPDSFRILPIVAALCLLIGYLVLRYTRFGRYVYMTGANPTAARLAGVNTNLILGATLAISGFMAGLAGMVNMGRLG